jgi:hypothetical protein
MQTRIYALYQPGNCCGLISRRSKLRHHLKRFTHKIARHKNPHINAASSSQQNNPSYFKYAKPWKLLIKSSK